MHALVNANHASYQDAGALNRYNSALETCCAICAVMWLILICYCIYLYTWIFPYSCKHLFLTTHAFSFRTTNMMHPYRHYYYEAIERLRENHIRTYTEELLYSIYVCHLKSYNMFTKKKQIVLYNATAVWPFPYL